MIPLIIDCDPGQDDAVMLMLAFANRDRLDVLGITTVAGNVGLEKTARNARIICELTGAEDVRVYAGCAAPLSGALRSATEVHGEEGMNGAPIYEPKMPLQELNAVDFIIQILQAAKPATITLAATGPLTNIATALMRAPDIARGIDKIVLMGGARCQGGNVTPSAEFNIYADPSAAEIVYESGANIVTIGLDVTHEVISDDARLSAIKAIENSVAQTAWSILGPHSFYDKDVFFTKGAPLHDPCVLAYILAPELFETTLCNLQVETASALTMGHTSIDIHNRRDPRVYPVNTKWAHSADVDGVYDILCAALARYSA